MPWANLDDKMPRHPKVIPLSDAAFRLHISGICYSAEHQTDGMVDLHVIPTLVPRYRRGSFAELLRCGRWHETEHTCPECVQPPAGQVVIHNYLDWNRSRQEIAAERERKSKAGKKGAQNRWR